MKVDDKEASVLQGATQMLSLLGFSPFRVHAGKIQTRSGHWMQFAPKGTPDLCARVPGSGRRLMVECKRPKNGKHTPEQRAFAADEIAGGGVCLLVSDLGRLRDALERLRVDPYATLDIEGNETGDG